MIPQIFWLRSPKMIIKINCFVLELPCWVRLLFHYRIIHLFIYVVQEQKFIGLQEPVSNISQLLQSYGSKMRPNMEFYGSDVWSQNASLAYLASGLISISSRGNYGSI